MNTFETNEFKRVLSRYEKSKREGHSIRAIWIQTISLTYRTITSTLINRWNRWMR